MTTPIWNLLVYAVATDPTTRGGINAAIEQMREALTADRCNVFVQVHTTAKTTRHWIGHGKPESVPSAADASNPEVLTEFMNYAHRAQPAEATALFMVRHSQGLDNVHGAALHATAPATVAADPVPIARAPRTTGTDSLDRTTVRRDRAPAAKAPAAYKRSAARSVPEPHAQRHLRCADLRRAIKRSSQKRVQVLGLNACWMASLEVEYELRSVADFQIASQGYASLWPYGAIVDVVRKLPASGAAKLARAIVEAVRAEIAAGKRKDTISAFASGTETEALADTLDRLARHALTMVEQDWESITEIVREARRIDDPYQVDLYSIAKALARQGGQADTAAARVVKQLAAMQIARAASDAHRAAHGLSILCPKTSDVDLIDAYRDIEFGTRPWAVFLRACQAKMKSLAGR